MRLTRRARDGIWMVDLRSQGMGRYSTGERDKAKALVEATRLLRDGPQKAPQATGGYTVGDALQDTWADIWQHQKSCREKWHTVEVVRRRWGDTPAEALTYREVHEWLMGLRRAGKAASTLNNYVSCLSKALGHAAQLGHVPEALRLPRISDKARRIRYLTPEEEDRLLDAAPDTEDGELMRKLMRVLSLTGCRLSEVIQAVPEDITNHTLLLPETKNSRPRSVPLTSEAEGNLHALLRNPRWRQITGRGRQSAKNWAVQRFAAIRDKARLPDVSLHIYRHTAASRLMQAGIDPFRVMEFLGHSSIEVTRRYAHLDTQHLQVAADVLGGIDRREFR